MDVAIVKAMRRLFGSASDEPVGDAHEGRCADGATDGNQLDLGMDTVHDQFVILEEGWLLTFIL